VYSAPPTYVVPPPPPVYYGSPVPSAAYPYDPYAVTRPPVPAVDARLVQVQDNLRRLGYYRGVVDGIIGEGTRSAIRSYQIDRGLPVTGRVDRALLQDLGL
jgi:peptidoglycan hydrolase-like protein with peptidoglycan-binding domain